MKSILLAEEVIAINQDPLGVAGDLVWKQGPNEVGPEESSCRALAAQRGAGYTTPRRQAAPGSAATGMMTCTVAPSIGSTLNEPSAAACELPRLWSCLKAACGRAWRQVYAAPLQGGGRAVIFFNRHHPEYPLNNVSVAWGMLGYDDGEAAAVRDLYARSDLGTHSGDSSHGSATTSPSQCLPLIAYL